MGKVVKSPTGNSPPTMVLDSTDGGLRVEFRWRHDRYEHRFLAGDTPRRQAPSVRDTNVRGAHAAAILGQSVEGDAENDWPPSPPIQQLSAETIAGEDVLLGVGAAGKSHWSISVETRKIDDTPVLKFDVACRCKVNPRAVGSLYQLAPQLAIEPLESAVLEDHGRDIAVRPAADDSTQRWSYLVRRIADDGSPQTTQSTHLPESETF